MCFEYYGLKEQPFGATPDPRFLYMSPGHREALASLYCGIDSGRGFLTLIAPAGTGKTAILFHLLERLRDSARTVFLFHTQCDSRELVRNVLSELGVKPRRTDLVHMHGQLNDILIEEMHHGRRFVLVIDEAHNLDESVLETVRLLSDFETPRQKLLQIVLAGQPLLADKLTGPRLRQLRQRISVVGRLTPLSNEQTSRYISYRLWVAGHAGNPLFTSEAVSLIARESAGIPRNINNLCASALTLGRATGKKKVDGRMMRQVLRDLEIAPAGAPSDPIQASARESCRSAQAEEPKSPSVADTRRLLRNRCPGSPLFFARRWLLGAAALLATSALAAAFWLHSSAWPTPAPGGHQVSAVTSTPTPIGSATSPDPHHQPSAQPVTDRMTNPN